MIGHCVHPRREQGGTRRRESEAGEDRFEALARRAAQRRRGRARQPRGERRGGRRCRRLAAISASA